MVKTRIRKIVVYLLALSCLMVIVMPIIMLNNGPIIANASVFPDEQILPGDVVSDGKETYVLVGKPVESLIDGKRYEVYRANQLSPDSYKVRVGSTIDYDGSNTGMIAVFAGISREDEVTIGVEVSASIGVSVGTEAFGFNAKVEVDVTSQLGISTSVGKGYSENVTFTLSPSTHKAGRYGVVTYAFVRKYKVISYEWVKEQVGTEKRGCDNVPVYKEYWGNKQVTYIAYVESYYYKLEKFA